jgi:hypothetical protein
MAAVEDDTGGPAIDVERINLADLEQMFLVESISEPRAQDTFAKIERTPIRINVAEPDEKVGVRRIALDPKPGTDAASDFGGFGQRFRSEDEQIITGLDWVLIDGTSGDGELNAADGGDGIRGIITVTQSARGVGSLLQRAYDPACR